MVIMVVSGPLAGQVFELNGDGPIAVGRQGTLPLGDTRISRRHAQLERIGHQWFIEDLGSANGTFLNDERVSQPTAVYDGDQVRLGRTVLVLGAVANGHVAPSHPADLAADQALAGLGPPPMPPRVDELAEDSAASGDASLHPLDEPIEPVDPLEPSLEPLDATLEPLDALEVAAPELGDEAAQVAAFGADQPVPNPAPAPASVQTTTALAAPASAKAAVSILIPRRMSGGDQELAVHRHHGGALGAPALPEPAPARLARRWLPVVVVMVMLLAIAAQAMLYLRSRESLDEIRGFITERDSQSQSEMLAAIDRQVTTRTVAERNLMLHEMAAMLERRDQEREQEQEVIRQLVLELRARSSDQRQAAAPTQGSGEQAGSPTTAPAAVAATPPNTAPPPGETAEQASARVPAAMAQKPSDEQSAAALPEPDVIFFVDATGKLANELPKVRSEIVRELARLSLDDEARVTVLMGDGIAEFPAELLAKMTQPSWREAIEALPRSAMARREHAPLASAIQAALELSPSQLHLLSDSLGGDREARSAARQAIDTANTARSAKIHAIQFTSRVARDDFKAIARENGGTYSFVP